MKNEFQYKAMSQNRCKKAKVITTNGDAFNRILLSSLGLQVDTVAYTGSQIILPMILNVSRRFGQDWHKIKASTRLSRLSVLKGSRSQRTVLPEKF